MKRKPDFFNIKHEINGYTFYESSSDQHSRVYVPRTEDFIEFIDALWSLLPQERRTKYARRNKKMFKRYPWLFVKNRWDGGIWLWDKDGNFKLNWFDYHEGDFLEEVNPHMFFSMQEEIAAELRENAPNSFYYYMIMDIKEKWWTLRWYDSGFTSNGHKIIQKYCDLYEVELGWREKSPYHQEYDEDDDDSNS